MPGASMTKYATNKPLGSMDPKDLFDNAQNLDFALNDITKVFWVDRFGKSRQSLFGMEQRFNLFIQNSGYKVIGDYTSGPLTINEYNQVIRYQGELWKITASTNIPFTTTGNDATSWVNDSTHFVSVGDGALRQELLTKRVYAVDFGDLPDGTNPTSETQTIQRAIDYVYSSGGGVVDLGPFTWTIGPSSLTETFDNYGVSIPASDCGIILRKGVSLVGQKGKTKITSSFAAISLIALVAPDGNLLSGFELAGGWSVGVTGAGHGIFQFGTAGGVDISCKNTLFEDLYIHNVASYGIGLQNGNPENVHLNRIRTDVTGADGLDLKARGSSAIPPVGNSATNIHASRFNLRVDGSAGIDMRGVWQPVNITVTDFGGDSTKSYTGIRFRTKPPVTDPYNKAAAKSTLNGFTVIPTPGAAALLLSGVECGSDDVHISNGTVEDCHLGVTHNGNSVGSAQRCSVTGVTSINARQYGFKNSSGCDDIKYIGCIDIGAASAGFRPEGTNCSLIGCTGTLSSSSGATATLVVSGGRMGDAYPSLERVSSAAVGVIAKGAAADIQLRLLPKGTGHIGAFGDIRPDVANTRYLGSGSLPWAGGWIQTAFTITSDERHKTGIASLLNADSDERKKELEALLRAWAEVDFYTYQYIDRVTAKGADFARWHFGVIAQRVIDAFTRHSLDWAKYSLISYSEWEASPAIYNEEGDLVQEAREAGNKYSFNYEEALLLEATLQRVNHGKLLDELGEMESRISALENRH